MPLTRIHHTGNILTTGVATWYTASSGLATEGFELLKVTLVNQSTALSGVASVYLVNLSSAIASVNIIGKVNVAPNDTVHLNGPWWNTSGATVQALMDTGGAALTGRMTALEET